MLLQPEARASGADTRAHRPYFVAMRALRREYVGQHSGDLPESRPSRVRPGVPGAATRTPDSRASRGSGSTVRRPGFGRRRQRLRSRGDARSARGPPPNRTARRDRLRLPSWRPPSSWSPYGLVASSCATCVIAPAASRPTGPVRPRTSAQPPWMRTWSAPTGRPPGTGWSHPSVAGQRPPSAGSLAAAGVDLEPPRVQLIHDASAVGIAIIVVLLIGPRLCQPNGRRAR